MPSWSGSWQTLLFNETGSESAAGPKLGVNYVQASAPSTTLKLAATSLVVTQDLATYGIAGVVWNCARAMVSFFEAEPQLVAQRHVLELGAGPGAVGLALASAGGVSSLLLTDLDSVVPLARENVRVSAEQYAPIATLTSSGNLDVHALCWGEPLSAAVDKFPVEVVVASDCLYESASHSALLATLLELTDWTERGRQADQPPSHVTVFLAYKQRIPAKEKVFFEAAAKNFDIAVYSAEAITSSGNNNNGNAIEFYDEAIYICKLDRSAS